MLKLMARTKEWKNLEDDLIGGFEKWIIRDVTQLLSARGYQYKTFIEMPDKSGEIDLIAFRSQFPKEILIVEAKALLDVDEVNEVQHATDELKNGQRQVERVKATLHRMSLEQKQEIWRQPAWDKVTSVCGLVVTPNSDPNSKLDQRTIPTVTLPTLKTKVRSARFKSPTRLVAECSKKPWLNEYVDAEEIFTSITVGDVTYEIPGWRLRQSEDDGDIDSEEFGADMEIELGRMFGGMKQNTTSIV